MALSDFAAGMQNALQAQIARRLQAEQEQQRQADALKQQQRLDADLALRQDAQRFSQDRTRREDEADAANKLALEELIGSAPAPMRGVLRTKALGITGVDQHDFEDPAAHQAHITADQEAADQRALGLHRGKAQIDAQYRAPQSSAADDLATYEAKKKIDAQYMGARPSLGGERNTLNYFNRMLEAEKNARAVEDQVTDRDVAVADVPLIPGIAENYLRSEAGQKYTQAQRAYTEARLRKESGAAIPQSEFDTDRKTNFRTLGDKPETIKQKRGMRLQTLRGIGNAAGRALQEYYGETATLDDLLKDFADAPAATGGAGEVEYDWVNGQLVPRK